MQGLIAQNEKLLVSAGDADCLSVHGIRVSHPGSSNVLEVDHRLVGLDLTVNFEGSIGARVTIGNSAPLTGKIAITGSGNAVCIAGMSGAQGPNAIKINMDGNRSTVHLGARLTSVSSHIILVGDDRSISLGEDCMLSWGITIHNYDHHTIFDLESGKQTNAPGNVNIGNHVWIGQDVLFAGEASVGSGSIIGARSLVAGDVPAKALAVGVPARAIKNNVSWARPRFATTEAIEAVRQILTAQAGPP